MSVPEVVQRSQVGFEGRGRERGILVCVARWHLSAPTHGFFCMLGCFLHHFGRPVLPWGEPP